MNDSAFGFPPRCPPASQFIYPKTTCSCPFVSLAHPSNFAENVPELVFSVYGSLLGRGIGHSCFYQPRRALQREPFWFCLWETPMWPHLPQPGA